MKKLARSSCMISVSLLVIMSIQTPFAWAAGQTAPFQIATTFHVGGEGGWDYVTVDSAHHLVYVTRTTHTMVLNAANGKLVADIPGQRRSHGVALVPAVGRGFISDGKDGSVLIFDLKTYAVLGKVKAANDADGIIYDPASRMVWVACGDAHALIAIPADVDPKTGKAEAPVALGGKPEFLAADGLGKVYVNLVNKDEIAVVDTHAMKVVDKWPCAPGGSPAGMAMDRRHRLLFVGCRHPQKLIVMRADNGSVVAGLPIGAGVDATASDDGYALASCHDGSLTVAHESASGTWAVVQTVRTPLGARTMGVDSVTHEVFLPTAKLEPRTGAHRRPIPKPGTFEIVVVRRAPR